VSNSIKKIDCYNELERVARLVVHHKQDHESLEQCRAALGAPLAALDKVRKEEAELREKKLKTKGVYK
jgi:hypothetical protein